VGVFFAQRSQNCWVGHLPTHSHATGDRRPGIRDRFAMILLSPSEIDHEWMYWPNANGCISEIFYHKKCVCILYTPTKGSLYVEGEIWRALQGAHRMCA
jgi:hypothetical protein